MRQFGPWNRIPILIIIDTNLEPDRLQAVSQACNEPDASITNLVAPSELIVDILQAMKNDGYARRILDDLPYEISDNIMQLAIMKAFDRICKNMTLTNMPAKPYGQINHMVNSSKDYKRIVEEYMSFQDPYTLQTLYGIRKPPAAAFLVVDMSANPVGTLSWTKTISASQVIVTPVGYDLMASNTVAVLDVPEVCTAEELAEEVMTQAMGLFEKVKKDNS